ncbi:MAG: AbrB/MazE/SpoVT family DNA-binding domain-containing protein [Clostridiales bacterium]|nr:AbrB/MazE/SpoVT family DNA-binding domain-containing protein [Clostridiales bacterium]
MKATGIVRRIDELGRIVIPKEIRRTMRLKEGEPLEIYTGGDSSITLKKYSPIKELGTYADEYSEALSGALGCPVIITDNDCVISVAGASKKEYASMPISKDMEKALAKFKPTFTSQTTSVLPILITANEHDSNEYYAQCICPIILNSDIVGGVVAFSKMPDRLYEQSAMSAVRATAMLASRQLS